MPCHGDKLWLLLFEVEEVTWDASFFAASPSTLRVTALTLYFGFLDKALTTEPPCEPVAPMTTMVAMVAIP